MKKNISLEVIYLATPIIISNLSRVLMSLADMSMVSRLGPTALAATGMGSLLIWVAMSMSVGIRTGVQTIAARRLGERKYRLCTNSLHNGVIISLILGIPLSVLGIIYSNNISNLFLNDSDVIKYCTDYLFIGYFGIIFVFISFAFQGFYSGVEQTKIHLIVTISSNILNIYLNAGLIYGYDNINVYLNETSYPYISKLWILFTNDALEVKGASLATLIASIFMTIQYGLFLFTKKIKSYKPAKFNIIIQNVTKQFFLGLPISIQELVTMLAFSIFYKIIGIVGTKDLAASEIILTIAHASFLPAVGIGMAGATLVGKYLGKKQYNKASRVFVESIKWSFLMMGFWGLIFIFFPNKILPIFSDDLEIIQKAIPCLKIVGYLQFFDAISLTLFFLLAGAGNTKFPSIMNVILAWFIFLPATYYFSIYLDKGILGAWFAFAAWIVPASIILTLKASTGSWKNITV